MTVTFEADGSSAALGDRRRRLPRTAAAVATGLILVGALATTLTLRHSDRQYGPVQGGSFGGIYSARNLVSSPDNWSSRLAGGSDTTAQLIASLHNRGSHSVKVTAVETDDVVTDVRWSSYRTEPGGYVSGIETPWQGFPADIPAHGTIRLLITVHRPAYCRTGSDTTGSTYSGYHRVHWSSLLGSHTTTVNDGITNIQLC